MRTLAIVLAGAAVALVGCEGSIGIPRGPAGAAPAKPGEEPRGPLGSPMAPAPGGSAPSPGGSAPSPGGVGGMNGAPTPPPGQTVSPPGGLLPPPGPVDPAGAGTGVAVSEALRKQRVDAGLAFYTSTTCVICHGNDGRKTVGNGKSLVNCSACGSWETLRSVIEKTMPPAAGPQFGPGSCSGDCASRTADWIWYVVNGWRLTSDGGTRPEKVAVVEGLDTRRIKSYAALKADFLRVFGKVPPSLEASAGAFKAVPKFWHEEASLGAVTLNVLANAAVQACQGETMPALEAEAVRGKCADWARRMWLRDATAAELQSCVDTAMVTTKTLALPRKRLDFACASMMLSVPALTF